MRHFGPLISGLSANVATLTLYATAFGQKPSDVCESADFPDKEGGQ
jgi:hypothetical protein